GLQLIATPIGLGAAGLIGYLWYVLTPLDEFFPNATILTVVWLLLSLVLIILVHELLHAAAHPKSDPHGISVIGFWPAKVVFYAAYLGPVPRNRFLFTLLLPLFVLSILPLLIAAIFQIESSLLAYISFVNTALAAGDLFGTMLVVYQVSRSAVICNQQHRTYWRDF
ncbi:MAG: DUF3267 domain-containing protein, partial [Chloroflexota bacterium]